MGEPQDDALQELWEAVMENPEITLMQWKTANPGFPFIAVAAARSTYRTIEQTDTQVPLLWSDAQALAISIRQNRADQLREQQDLQQQDPAYADAKTRKLPKKTSKHCPTSVRRLLK